MAEPGDPASDAAASRPLVIGLGTEDRGDDGLGLDAVRALRSEGGVAADLVEGPGDLTRLLDLFEGRERVVIIDAVRSGASPGTLHRFERTALPAAAKFAGGREVSSHGVTLGDVLELGWILNGLPKELVIVGLEAGAPVWGSERSSAVRESLPTLCARVRDEVSASAMSPPSSLRPTPGGPSHA